MEGGCRALLQEERERGRPRTMCEGKRKRGKENPTVAGPCRSLRRQAVGVLQGGSP
jgi:hypothetical protein